MSMLSSFCFFAGAGVVRSQLLLPYAVHVLACARKMWVLPRSIFYSHFSPFLERYIYDLCNEEQIPGPQKATYYIEF
ncbi:hypothetical protein EDD85DRAFT_807262 [Armillaria nabsnona]|nr:hypothetical protein EDD85DRAFT_807262 [Armillaria nabsnona]